MLKININTQVKIKLTDYGKLKLLSKSTLDYYNFVLSKITKDGYWELPLWEVMYYFGDDMFMGNNKQPIVDNDIFIEETKIKAGD